MLPLFFLNLCAHKMFATFYQDPSVFGTTCMKYVPKHFWKEHLCALQVFLCVLVSQLVCARAHSLRGTLPMGHKHTYFNCISHWNLPVLMHFILVIFLPCAFTFFIKLLRKFDTSLICSEQFVFAPKVPTAFTLHQQLL